jgi:hypothetical protein
MESFARLRFQHLVHARQDLASLVDANRSLREQVVGLLLELDALREHVGQRKNGSSQPGLPTRN